MRLHRWRDVPAKRTLEFHYEEGRRTPRAVTVYEGGYSYRLALGADQVGTVKTVADGTGYLIKELQYDSFGNQLEDSNPGFYLPLGFAGGIRDRHTGLVRFGWRYYMPEAGRFTAPDPARWAGGDPDLYDYCVDDPIGKVDPLGLEPEDVDKDGNKLGVNENGDYWTVKVGSDKACDRCREMAKNTYAHEPKRPHPNCKCEYTKHNINDGLPDVTYVDYELPGFGVTMLDSTFAEKVGVWIEANRKQNIRMSFSQGFRTTQDQIDVSLDPNSITPAAPGTSLHEAGRAVDIRIKDRYTPEQYAALESNADKAGLGSGRAFDDHIHFYLEVPGGRSNRGKYIRKAQWEAKRRSGKR